MQEESGIVEFNNIKVRKDGFVLTKNGWTKGTKRIFGNLVTYVVAYVEGGKKKQCYVSRLMGICFLGLNPKDRKTLVCYINRRTEFECDNSVENLYLGNNSDNMRDRIKDKTCPVTGRKGNLNSMYGKVGCLNPASKPISHYETFSTTISTFKKICKNQSWDFDKFIKIGYERVNRTKTTGYYKFFWKYIE